MFQVIINCFIPDNNTGFMLDYNYIHLYTQALTMSHSIFKKSRIHRQGD